MRTLKQMACVVAVLLLAACGGSSSAAPPTPPPAAAVTVEIKNIAFNPRTITIKAGQTVAWKFDDGSIVHNVTGSNWRSQDIDTGYYTHTFTAAGTYTYQCTIHSGMDGVVMVTP